MEKNDLMALLAKLQSTILHITYILMACKLLVQDENFIISDVSMVQINILYQYLYILQYNKAY